MSDPTDQGAAGADFRGSREEKRQDETVMINADNLSDMVASAKGGTPVEPTSGASGSSEASGASASPSKGLPDDELADSQLGRILVIAGIIVVLLAAIIIIYVNVIA